MPVFGPFAPRACILHPSLKFGEKVSIDGTEEEQVCVGWMTNRLVWVSGDTVEGKLFVTGPVRFSSQVSI